MAKTMAEVQREYAKRTNYAAQRKYLDEKVRRYVISCNTETDVDIIEYLDLKDNKAGYIKDLIRMDMEKWAQT